MVWIQFVNKGSCSRVRKWESGVFPCGEGKADLHELDEHLKIWERIFSGFGCEAWATAKFRGYMQKVDALVVVLEEGNSLGADVESVYLKSNWQSKGW